MPVSEPRVSVIVPVSNGEAYLAEAVASVRAQDAAGVEIVVVDDGSTDGTAGIARGLPGVRLLSQRNRGPAAARNRGLEAARGDVLAFLDADDLWTPAKLAVQLPRLLEDPGLDAVSGRIQCVTPDRGPGEDMRLIPIGPPRRLPSFGSLLARRRVFERVGPLDESLRWGEDVDWFLRARECAIRMLEGDEVVLWYRLHGQNTTRGRLPQEVGYARAVKKVLDRRREMRRGQPVRE